MKQSFLTHKQQAVLDFIQRYFEQWHRSPLIREIQEGCGIISYKSALDRLNALERKAFIKRQSNKHRGIKLLKRPDARLAGALQSNEQQPVSREDGKPAEVMG